MTDPTVIILAVWAIGIVASAAALATLGRRALPELDTVLATDPAGGWGLVAALSVFWPAILVVVVLIRLVRGGR